MNEIEQVDHGVAFQRGPSAARQQGVPRSPCSTCPDMLPLNGEDVNHIQGELQVSMILYSGDFYSSG